MRLRSSDQVEPGHALISQPGEIVLCRLADLIYEPGAGDDEIDMVVNPVDVAAAKAMWFEPRESVQ